MPPFFSTPSLSGLRSRSELEDPDKAQSLTSEKVRILYSNLWQPVYAGILGAILLVSIMWAAVDPVVLISWLVAIIADSLAAGVAVSSGRRIGSGTPEMDRLVCAHRFCGRLRVGLGRRAHV